MMQEMNLKAFVNYVELSARPMTPEDMSRNNLDILAVSHALSGELGELQNILKKHYRDGGWLDRHAVILELGDVFHYFVRLLSELGFTLEEVMVQNIDKLEHRRRENGKSKAT